MGKIFCALGSSWFMIRFNVGGASGTNISLNLPYPSPAPNGYIETFTLPFLTPLHRLRFCSSQHPQSHTTINPHTPSPSPTFVFSYNSQDNFEAILYICVVVLYKKESSPRIPSELMHFLEALYQYQIEHC